MKKKTSTANKDEFSREFSKRESLFNDLRGEALHTLERQLKKAKIKIHSIPSRIKNLDSCLGKIERFQIDEPFEQIQDFVGLRIICLFLSDIPKIGEVIKKSFDVIKFDGKIESNKRSSFGYMSDHYIVKFGESVKGYRYDDIKEMPFEIQVRTIAMDSWANISHYLDYKTDQDIPEELKRDFYALSGMFYVADKHFQLFFEQRHEKQEEIAETFEKGSKKDKFDQPINLDTLTAYLQEKFPDRGENSSQSISELIEELKEANYRTIAEINEVVEKTQDAFIKYEKKHPPTSLDKVYSPVGILRVSFEIFDDDFLKVRQRRDITWDKDLIEREKTKYLQFKKYIKNK